MNRRQQRHGHAQPQDPPQRGKQRHVHVVEHEHLVAQHGQAIEILGTLVVGDRRHRRLQPRHVRLERDGHLVAEAPLHAGADRAQKPGGGRRHAKADRRPLDPPRPVLQHAFAQQHSHKASSASGSAASCDSTNDTTISRGSWR